MYIRYEYIYIKKKQQTGHIRIIDLFPGKFKCSLLNSFLVLMELLPTPVSLDQIIHSYIYNIYVCVCVCVCG